MYGTGTQIDLETGEIGLHSTPTVANDMVIVGSSFKEGMTVETYEQHEGAGPRLRRADRQDALALQHDSASPASSATKHGKTNSWAFNGNTGVWTQITVDRGAGLVYLPVESPTSDFYGGKRPGNNLYGESLVAVDLKTGVSASGTSSSCTMPIWDHDMSSAPLLMDVTIDGQAAQGRGGAEQTELAVRLRSHHRAADLADRRNPGAAVGRAGREDLADATDPHQAAAVRAALTSPRTT